MGVSTMWPPLLVVLSLFLEAFSAKPFVHLVYSQNDTCLDFKAVPACFGPSIPPDGLKGSLVEISPANACQPIKAVPASNRTPSGFIALIRRYDCPFGVKVFHAQNAGYQAAVIYNLYSDFLVSMAIEREDVALEIAIPSLLIGRTASKLLRRQARSSKDGQPQIMAVVPPDYYNPCWEPGGRIAWDLDQHYLPVWPSYCTQQKFIKFLQEFGLVIGLSMVTSILLLASWAKWGRHGQGVGVKTFRSGDRYDLCVICMADYEEGDRLKVLPCSHVFHSTCINTWLLVQPAAGRTCPICKQKVNSTI